MEITTKREAALRAAWERWKAATTDRERDAAYREAERGAAAILRSHVARYAAHHDGDDMMQAARLALVQALDGYDEERGAGLATYIERVLRTRLADAALRATRGTGEGAAYADGARLSCRRRNLASNNGREPTDDEVIASARDHRESVALSRALQREKAGTPPCRTVSLFASPLCPSRDDEEEGEWQDRLPDPSPAVEDVVAGASWAADTLTGWLAACTPIQAAVVRARVVDGMGCSEAAEAVGVSAKSADNAWQAALVKVKAMGECQR
jgi:RNA polymerase sigma factor, sigma-70 family